MDFVRFEAEETEAQFKQIEDRARQAIDAAIANALTADASEVTDLRDLNLLHAVRSKTFAKMHRRGAPSGDP